MSADERKPILRAGSPLTSSNTFSFDSSASNTSGLMSDKTTLTPHDPNSLNSSLRIARTDNPPLSTVWSSQPTDSIEVSPNDLIDAHERQAPITEFQFFMQIVRASVGTGVLALPSAVADAGLVFGMVGILVTSLIIIHCVHMLIECSHFLRSQFGLGNTYLDYGNTVKYSFTHATSSVRRYKWTWILSNIGLGIVQFGIAVVYIIFVTDNVKDLVEHYQPDFKQPTLLYMVCVSAVIMPLIFIKSIKLLSFVSEIGNVLMIIGLGMMLVYCFQDIPPLSKYPLITTVDKIPLFFGVAVFSFESITCVMPSEMALENKTNLKGVCGLLNMSFYIVLIVYLVVAFFGYVKFGENVQGSLTYSLPFSPWYALVVKPLYAVLIAVSFGLQFYVVMDIQWRAIVSVTPERWHKTWVSNVMRIVMFLVVFGMAAGIPYIQYVISLFGAFAGSLVCIIIPSLVYLALFWDYRHTFRCFKLVIIKNTLIALFGVFGFFVGSYSSIVAIYNAIEKDRQKG